MPENRRSKRVPAKVKVWCEGDDFTVLAETVNLSLHGLFVRTAGLPQLGGAFRVNIDDPGSVANVEVRWVRDNREPGRGGMGLRIVGFERGADEYAHYVSTLRSPSGEFRLAWQPPALEDDGEDPT